MRLDINRAGVGLLPRVRHPRASSLVSQPRCSEVLHAGRTWWAHFEFTRTNIEPFILRKKILFERTTAALDRTFRHKEPGRLKPHAGT